MNQNLFFTKLFALAFFLIVAVACDKSSDELLGTSATTETETEVLSATVKSTSTLDAVMTQEAPNASACGETTVVSFLAGQYIEAGVVSVFNTEDKLYITVTMNDPWVISQTHLYVGDPNLVPTNKKGNPQIGHFPISDEFTEYTSVVTYEFNLEDFDESFMIAFHADVHMLDSDGIPVQDETAWADGTQFIVSGSWASYFMYTKQSCDDECVFETEYFEMFGGQTIPVGNLIVTNDEENLYITYDGDNGWQFATVHLYVGDLSGLPTNNQNTPVPGSFPYVDESNTLRETVSFVIPLENLPLCYIIAAHGEANLTDENGQIIQSETSWSYGTEFPNTNRWGWYSSYCTQFCVR